MDECRLWCERVVPDELSSIPPALREPGALASFSGHIAGGTHHAFADRGEGFYKSKGVMTTEFGKAPRRDMKRVQPVEPWNESEEEYGEEA